MAINKIVYICVILICIYCAKAVNASDSTDEALNEMLQEISADIRDQNQKSSGSSVSAPSSASASSRTLFQQWLHEMEKKNKKSDPTVEDQPPSAASTALNVQVQNASSSRAEFERWLQQFSEERRNQLLADNQLVDSDLKSFQSAAEKGSRKWLMNEQEKNYNLDSHASEQHSHFDPAIDIDMELDTASSRLMGPAAISSHKIAIDKEIYDENINSSIRRTAGNKLMPQKKVAIFHNGYLFHYEKKTPLKNGGWVVHYKCSKRCKGPDKAGKISMTRLSNRNGVITLNHEHAVYCQPDPPKFSLNANESIRKDTKQHGSSIRPIIPGSSKKLPQIMEETDEDESVQEISAMPTNVHPRIRDNQGLNIGDEVFLTALTPTDMDELAQSDGWLSNFVINAYLDLITRNRNDVRFVPSHVMTAFRDENVIAQIWLQQIEQVGISSVRFWLIPSHLMNGTHWALALFDRRQKEIVLCDSLNRGRNTQDNGAFKADLFNFFARLFAHFHQNLYMSEFRWINRADIPAQENTWDCGVFVLMYAEQIIRSSDILTNFTFNQNNILECRARIHAELMAHRFPEGLARNQFGESSSGSIRPTKLIKSIRPAAVNDKLTNTDSIHVPGKPSQNASIRNVTDMQRDSRQNINILNKISHSLRQEKEKISEHGSIRQIEISQIKDIVNTIESGSIPPIDKTATDFHKGSIRPIEKIQPLGSIRPKKIPMHESIRELGSIRPINQGMDIDKTQSNASIGSGISGSVRRFNDMQIDEKRKKKKTETHKIQALEIPSQTIRTANFKKDLIVSIRNIEEDMPLKDNSLKMSQQSIDSIQSNWRSDSIRIVNEESMTAKYVKNEYGGYFLVHNGYIYLNVKNFSPKSREEGLWMCEERNTKECMGEAKIDNINNKIIRSTEHNHVPRSEKLKGKKTYSNFKDRLTDVNLQNLYNRNKIYFDGFMYKRIIYENEKNIFLVCDEAYKTDCIGKAIIENDQIEITVQHNHRSIQDTDKKVEYARHPFGGFFMLHDGFVYERQARNRWACEDHHDSDTPCLARATVDSENRIIYRSDHNHERPKSRGLVPIKEFVPTNGWEELSAKNISKAKLGQLITHDGYRYHREKISEKKSYYQCGHFDIKLKKQNCLGRAYVTDGKIDVIGRHNHERDV